jgi:geranylgeranyl pyrophosphate synthase
MKQLFEAQDFISKTSLSADVDLHKIKKALYTKSAEPFRLMAEYTARMADADNPLLIKNARSIGKAVGYCYWIIDDAKDVWCDLEAGQWNLFLQLAASKDPPIFSKDRDTFTNSRLINILEHSNYAQKISTQIIKKLVDATLQLALSKKVEHESMGLISASLWQWFHY